MKVFPVSATVTLNSESAVTVVSGTVATSLDFPVSGVLSGRCNLLMNTKVMRFRMTGFSTHSVMSDPWSQIESLRNRTVLRAIPYL